MDERLQRLIDEDDVRRLVLTWIDGIDTRSVDQIRSAWADEMNVEFVGFPDRGGGPIASGRFRTADRGPNLGRMLGHFAAIQHVCTNHLVTVDGDHATCSAYVHATRYMVVEQGDP